MDDEKMERWRDMLRELHTAKNREEQEAILQKMYDGTLTPEDLAKFFPKD